MPSSTSLRIGLLSCGCSLFIVILSLILASYSTLEPAELGLDYDDTRKYIHTDQVYREGRYFLGLGHSFLKFPAIIQTLTISSLPSRTKDGLSVILDGTVQWKMISSKESLVNTYSLFMEDFAAAYEKVAKDRLRNVAARFSAFQLYFNRSAVGAAMGREMALALEPIGAAVESFQLLNFQLPTEFETAIATTEAKKQEIQQTYEEQKTARKEAESRVAVALQQAEVIRVEARAEADAFLFARQADADSLNVTYAAERDAYGALLDSSDYSLGLSPDELLTYIWLSALEETAAKQVMQVDIPSDVSCEGDECQAM